MADGDGTTKHRAVRSNNPCLLPPSLVVGLARVGQRLPQLLVNVATLPGVASVATLPASVVRRRVVAVGEHLLSPAQGTGVVIAGGQAHVDSVGDL